MKKLVFKFSFLTNPTFLGLSIILLVGGFLRLLNFPNVPYGLNQDEVNAGYEAWSLLHFGTDRWGEHWPVYFLSWGSGQNVLYSYFLIPFIAVFGATDFTIRLGMVVVGILLPLLVFFLTKIWLNKQVGLIAAGVVAIFPELVRGSRWAVESNFVPFMSTLGLLCFSLALLSKTPKKKYIIVSLIPLALVPYAYIITIVPVLLTVLIMLVWKRKKFIENKLAWVWALVVFTIMLIPLALFGFKTTVLNNKPYFFEQWLPFSIPAMSESRYEQLAEKKNGFFDIVHTNFVQLFSGNYNDQIGGGMNISHIPLFFIIISFILVCIPKIRVMVPFNILHVWVVAALPLAFVVPLSNIRGNLFYVPFIILTSSLLWFVYLQIKNIWVKIVYILLLLGYVVYVSVWYVSYQTKPSDFFYQNIEETVLKVEELNKDKAPVLFKEKENLIHLPNLQLMWFLKMTPSEIAEYDTDVNLRNYYFDEENLPVGVSYYEIVNTNFKVGCIGGSSESGKILYSKDDWAIYECDVK